ncbi:MAG TPA: helix-turn-helix domain-containing protein [Kofleriaceae bacterium]|nr:helix-turn-helix domain-containing protein [Kofleriaceae bacterium]
MRIAVLVLDRVFDSGLAIMLDTFATANELAGRRPGIEVIACGTRATATTANGLRIALADATGVRSPDVVVVPALGAKTRDTILDALESAEVRRAGELLRAWSKAGAITAGACTATFVLARSGLLDGRRATTTWWLSPVFREAFPRVALDDHKMLVKSSRFVTAGAALAHVDLALWLVRQRSPALAQLAARYLVFDERPSQASFIAPDHLAHADPLVARFDDWLRHHLDDFTLAGAARQLGTSERTLERRLRTILGKTPVSYLQDVRVELAIHRLRTTGQSIEEIASAVGYRDGVTLRTLLRRKTGRGVREFRGRARLRAGRAGISGGATVRHASVIAARTSAIRARRSSISRAG